MATKAQVIELHAKYPNWTAPQIAESLGASAAYVRATAQRQGLKLPSAYRGSLVNLGRIARSLGYTEEDLKRLPRMESK